MVNRGNAHWGASMGWMHYVAALMPLFSRLAIIAVITLSHSASWVAPDPAHLAAAEGIETAFNEQREPFAVKSHAKVTVTNSTTRPDTHSAPDSTASIAAAIDRFVHGDETRGSLGSGYLPLYRPAITGH